MIHNATRVAYNVTSYTVQETGLYVLLCSYSMTTGGTATKIYTQTDYNNTRTFYWANVGETITASSSNYNKIVYISGYDEPPIISLLADGSPTATYNLAENGKTYLGTVAGNSNSPSTLNYSFTCPDSQMVVVPWDDTWGDWSRTACALIEPYQLTTITATMNAGGSNDKHAYIYEIINSVEIQPENTGRVIQSVYNDGRTIVAEAYNGFLFDGYELKDYVELDYIESSGTQYIDTGISGNAQVNNLRVIGDVMYTGNFSDKYFMGMRLSSGDTRRYMLGSYNGKWYFNMGNSAKYSSQAVVQNQKYRFEVQTLSGNSYVKIDGQTVITDTQNLTSTGNYNLPLFALNMYGTIGYNVIGRLYPTQMYVASTGVMLRNYIPVLKISTGEVGLYDLVGMKFYKNKGTGVFTYGTEYDKVRIYDNPLYITNSSFSDTLVANFKSNTKVYLEYDRTLGNASYSWVSGVSVKLVATPNSNGQFKGWYVNSLPISTNSTYIINIGGRTEITFEARFEPIYEITEITEGNGFLEITRGTIDKNDIQINVLPNPNNHFIKYEITGLELEESTLLIQNGNILTTETGVEINAVAATSTVEFTETPLNFHIVRNIIVKAYFEEDDRFHLAISTNIKETSVYISDNDVFKGTPVTLWARPFPDYYFVKWSDEVNDNPRTIVMGASNLTLTAIYQRVTDTNGIYQYRCYVKDQLDMTALPKAFLKVSKFTIKTDLMTNANSTIYVLEEPENLNNGDVLVLYDPKGQFLYNGVIKSIDDKKITCSQMQSFYKGLWIYNVSPQDFLEHEIAVLLQDYADGKVYGCSYVDPLIAQRLGGITIDYVGLTTAKLPTDLDDQGRLNYTEKDMETFIYELYENYGIIFDFEINPSGPNYVHIKVPTYSPVKVGDNIFAIKDMSPITTIEETNKLIIYSADKVYKTTYIATKSEIIEAPTTIVDRFDITKTKVVFSDDDISDLVANNLPSQMYNHRLTFTLLIKNFVYQFGDFNLGGQLDIYHGSDYYNSVLTGYEIQKRENQNITEVNFVCGKVRQKLTQLLTLGKV